MNYFWIKQLYPADILDNSTYMLFHDPSDIIYEGEPGVWLLYGERGLYW